MPGSVFPLGSPAPPIDWAGVLIGCLWLAGAAALVARASYTRSPTTENAVTRPDTLGRPAGWMDQICAWLVCHELLLLGLAAPLFVFPTAQTGLILALLPLLWLARRQHTGAVVPHTPFNGAILGLVCMIAISLYATPIILLSLGKLAGLLWHIAVYYALVQWIAGGRRLHTAVAGYGVLGAGVAAVGLLAGDWGVKNVLGGSLLPKLTLSSGLINPNEIGGALTWIVPLQIAWLIGTWPGRPVVAGRALRSWGAGLAMAGFSAGVLLLTQSRSALLGATAGLLLILWLLVPQRRKALAAGAIIGGVAVVVAAAYLLTAGDSTLPAPSSLTTTVTFRQRLEVWGYALQAVQDFPLTGMGMDNFRRTMLLLYPGFAQLDSEGLPHAHNQLLQAAMDLGLPGLVCYAAVWLLAGFLAVRAWRRATEGRDRALVAGIGGSLLAFFVYGLTDAVALGAKPEVFFWALLALLVALPAHRAADPAETASLRHGIADQEQRRDPA